MCSIKEEQSQMKEHSNALSRRAFVGCAAAAGATLCFTTFDATDAFAVTSAEKKAEAQAALDTLNSLSEKADRASDTYYSALEAQQEAQDKMDEAQGKIDDATSQISQIQEQLGTRARSMYRSGSISFLDLLLGSTTFQAFTNNWSLLNNMNDADSQMVDQTKQLREEIETQKAEYEKQEQEAATQAQAAKAAKEEADAVVAQQQAVYDGLTAEVQQLVAEEEAAREKAAQEAAAKREEEARQAAAAQSTSSSTTSSGGGSTSSTTTSTTTTTNKTTTTTTTTTVNNNASQAVDGGTAVSRAYSKLGCPYVWGAGGPDSFDCSGFVSYCLTGTYNRALGTTYTMAKYPQVTTPEPGDICWRESHVGLYIGGGQMIHAPRTGDVVKIAGVPSNMIYRRYTG
jgi:peptidoglycan hydrolase CwlO-like protein